MRVPLGPSFGHGRGALLTGLGFARACKLKGGTPAWRDAGLPVEGRTAAR